MFGMSERGPALIGIYDVKLRTDTMTSERKEELFKPLNLRVFVAEEIDILYLYREGGVRAILITTTTTNCGEEIEEREEVDHGGGIGSLEPLARRLLLPSFVY